MDENARCVFYVEKWENVVSDSQAIYIAIASNVVYCLSTFHFHFPGLDFLVFLLPLSYTFLELWCIFLIYTAVININHNLSRCRRRLFFGHQNYANIFMRFSCIVLARRWTLTEFTMDGVDFFCLLSGCPGRISRKSCCMHWEILHQEMEIYGHYILYAGTTGSNWCYLSCALRK